MICTVFHFKTYHKNIIEANKYIYRHILQPIRRYLVVMPFFYQKKWVNLDLLLENLQLGFTRLFCWNPGVAEIWISWYSWYKIHLWLQYNMTKRGWVLLWYITVIIGSQSPINQTIIRSCQSNINFMRIT